MPIAAVYLDDRAILGKNKVWSAGQGFVVKPEPEAKSVQTAPDYQLRFGVF